MSRAKGFNAIGHCDLCFDGEVIAYGNYDEGHSIRFGMGPGVLILSKKEEYIPFCLRFNKTTIFSFGLRLTEDQKKERVRQRVARHQGASRAMGSALSGRAKANRKRYRWRNMVIFQPSGIQYKGKLL